MIAGVDVGNATTEVVLVAGDEGVLVANRLPDRLPVIDQVDTAAVGRALADHANAVVGLLPDAPDAGGADARPGPRAGARGRRPGR